MDLKAKLVEDRNKVQAEFQDTEAKRQQLLAAANNMLQHQLRLQGRHQELVNLITLVDSTEEKTNGQKAEIIPLKPEQLPVPDGG